MHYTSLSKIESASSFLLWFRSNLPQEFQHCLRPYLAQPYQSALKVLDCCNSGCPVTVEAIAQQTQLSKASVRQMLKVLQSVELVTPVNSSTKEWRSQPVSEALAEQVPVCFLPYFEEEFCS